MDKDFVEFLQNRGVSQTVIDTLENEKATITRKIVDRFLFLISCIYVQIDYNVIAAVPDVNVLEPYFPLFGDRIAVFNFCKQKVDKKARKLGLMDIIKRKIEKKRNKKRKKSPSSSSSGEDNKSSTNLNNNLNKEIKTRQVCIGWICSINGAANTQVRLKQGGGTRYLSVAKTAKREDLLEAGKTLFFQNGTSPKGTISDFNFDIWDFQQNPVSSEVTVGEMFQLSGLSRLRFYLVSTQIATMRSGNDNMNVKVQAPLEEEVTYLDEYQIEYLSDPSLPTLSFLYDAEETAVNQLVPLPANEYTVTNDTPEDGVSEGINTFYFV